jgi:hypothetical protein
MNAIAQATAESNDVLSLVGLTEPAYLRLSGSVAWKPNGNETLGTAEYLFAVAGFNPEYDINNLSQPYCTLNVPVTPNTPVALQRVSTATAIASLTDFPAGTYDANAIILGYPPPGGATLIVSVRDANGQIIKGVSVVGASGHIYN